MNLHSDLIELISYINEHSANRLYSSSPLDNVNFENIDLDALKKIAKDLNDKI